MCSLGTGLTLIKTETGDEDGQSVYYKKTSVKIYGIQGCGVPNHSSSLEQSSPPFLAYEQGQKQNCV